MKKRLILIIFLVLLLGVGILVYIGQYRHRHTGLYYSGTIEATQANLAFQVSGGVKEVLVDEGQAVTKDKLLEENMLEETGRVELEKGLRILWIIWAAMLGSLFIYVFICHQVGEEIRGNTSPDLPIGLLKNILYGAVIVTLFLAHFLRRFMLTGRFSSSETKLFKPASISNQPSLLAKYTIAVFVSLALCESIGLYGLVLFFLGDDLQTLYIFITISALSMFFYRPKMEELERVALIMKRD